VQTLEDADLDGHLFGPVNIKKRGFDLDRGNSMYTIYSETPDDENKETVAISKSMSIKSRCTSIDIVQSLSRTDSSGEYLSPTYSSLTVFYFPDLLVGDITCTKRSELDVKHSYSSVNSDDFVSSPGTSSDRKLAPLGTVAEGHSENSSPVKPARAFRRSLSDSTHETATPPKLTMRKAPVLSKKAKSFDESESKSAIEMKRKDARNQSSPPRSASSVTDSVRQFIRRGQTASLSLASVLLGRLSRTNSAGDEWELSTDSGDIERDKESGHENNDVNDHSKYDMLANSSGHHRHNQSLSSQDVLTSANSLENEFRRENDEGNVDQFRRMLILLGCCYAGHAIIGI
jgi:hypothetical protein